MISEGLPKGFTIQWFRRHDPFESVYALYFETERWYLADYDDSEEDQINSLRLLAWRLC